MSKTETASKSKSKKTSSGQKVKRAHTLLKGIDNSLSQIDKHKVSVAASSTELRNLLSGLSNDFEAAASTAKAAKAAKVKTKAEPKAAKPKKTSTGAGKDSGSEERKSAVPGRPTIKEAISEVIRTQGPDTKAELYRKVVDQYGYWSRQSYYNAVNDTKIFTVKDKKIHLCDPKPEEKKAEPVIEEEPPEEISEADKNVDTFVDAVAKDSSVNAVA